MNPILERIKKIAEYENMRFSALEASIGASKGVFSRALANGTDIQSKWLVHLIENYPQYSSEWLLAGKGEMLKKDVLKDSIENYLPKELEDITNAVIDALKMVVSSQEKTIQSLEKQVLFLEEEVQKLKKAER